MDQLGNTVLMIVMIIGISIILLWSFVRGDQILDKWAIDNGYKITEREYKFFWNIFKFSVSQGQSVYRVTVIDSTGKEKNGLVRCGGWWLGILVNKASVKWDE
jgi:hypothetical protein